MIVMRTAAALLTLCFSTAIHAQSLEADARAARDAERLAATARAHQSTTARDDERRQRRKRQRQALQQTEALLATREADNQALRARVLSLDDDLTQLQAVTASTLQTQRLRLQRGPLAADRSDLLNTIDQLAAQSASLDALYGAWFSLHEEWLEGGRITRTQQPVTLSDGIRKNVELTRFGAIALAYDTIPVSVSPGAGLIAGGPAAPSGASADYFRQQVYDSGAIGVALLLCALAAVVIILRRRGLDLLSLIASASLLLGLLGTVVGLIHTFRGLARYGGTDVSVAADGISHALATTWMGLVLAISLMLLAPIVARLPQRADRAKPMRRRRRRVWPLMLRRPTALGTALVFGVALFYLMQWLTQRPLSAPPPPDAVVRVERIDWSTPPPPPPPPPSAPTTVVDALPGTPTFALTQASTLPAPAPGIDAPSLDIAPGLSGLGGGGLPAAGALWSGASGGGGIVEGSDLVPISSARPRYPKAALEAGVDGWVEAIFRIDASGRVSDVRIIDAQPPGVFEQAAAQALARWLYAPLYRDGRPVAREATQLLRFSHREARVDGGR